MHGGLELARPQRRKIHRWWLVPLAAAVLWWGLPRLGAALPAGLNRADRMLAEHFVPHYTERLTGLQQQNAGLHARLAQAENALAENEALRSLLDCRRVTGSWQPARVVQRHPQGVTLACRAVTGASVADPLGRWAGQVTAVYQDGTCAVTFAGQETPVAGLCGDCAGLLETQGGWRLTGLPADSGLQAGAVVTTPDGTWLGTLARDPVPEADGLTANVPLADTADLGSTVFFVKN